ncbi:MAG TPA: hypothetical protein VIV40_01675 [Kofleriaceae bacterium]
MRRLALIALLGLAGCVTPSIPIPPPDPQQMVFTVTTDPGGAITSASLTYPPTVPYIGGVVYVFNRSIGHGIIETAHPNGSIGPTTPVAASLGDELVISVENDDQTVSTCVLLKEGAPSGYCP